MYGLAVRVVLGLGDRVGGGEGRSVGGGRGRGGEGELTLRHGWLER